MVNKGFTDQIYENTPNISIYLAKIIHINYLPT